MKILKDISQSSISMLQRMMLMTMQFGRESLKTMHTNIGVDIKKSKQKYKRTLRNCLK